MGGFACMYVCTCVCMYTHTYVYIYIKLSADRSMHVYINLCVCRERGGGCVHLCTDIVYRYCVRIYTHGGCV